MKRIMAGAAALPLIFSIVAAQPVLADPSVKKGKPETMAGLAYTQQEEKVRGLANQLRADSAVFRALTDDSISGKWKIRFVAPGALSEEDPELKRDKNLRYKTPSGREPVRSLYAQSRAMRAGMIAIDIEEDSDDAVAVNRIIDAMVEAYQVQQGLSPYVLGLEPAHVAFGMEPALGAQAETIKLGVMLEIEEKYKDKMALKDSQKWKNPDSIAWKNRGLAIALETYRESGATDEFNIGSDQDRKDKQKQILSALLASYKELLKAENGISHVRAGQAISGMTRLCMYDATDEEKEKIHPFFMQELPLERLGMVPGIGNLFTVESKEKVWGALADKTVPKPEMLREFARGMEKWYKSNAHIYGKYGVMTDKWAKRNAIKAIDDLLAGTASIDMMLSDIKAENEERTAKPTPASLRLEDIVLM